MALGNNIKRDKLIPNNNKPLLENEKDEDLLRFFEKNRTEIKLEPKKETPLYKIDNEIVSPNISKNIKQNTKQIFISQDDFSELNLFATELVSQSNFIKKNLTEITEDLTETPTKEDFSNDFDNNSKKILQNLEQNEKEFFNTNKAFNLLDENKVKTLTSAENAEKSLDTFITGISEVQKTSRILTEISAQSGVLAINAAIEAARVGDAGRSFVVIADEIRKISDNAKKSSDNIEDALRGLQKDMQMALKALFQMKNYLENQEFAINQLSQNIENITKNNTTMVDMIKNNQNEIEVKEDKPSNFSTEKINNKKTKKAQIVTDKLENINHTAQNLHSIAKQLHENLKNMS
jgi:methyl-accepting chemotaxis protein